MIDVATVTELLGRWWFHYDEGHFDVLESLVTEDVEFSCRTDSGKTDYEEFVRAELRGREPVLAWQTEHRLASPYPLRHVGSNVHLTGSSGGDTHFASYLFVTQIVEGQVSNLSTAVVTGSARREGSAAKLSSLRITLDTENSTVFEDRRR